MNGDFIEALRQIEKEKEIPFATLLRTLEVALGKAYRKHYNIAGDVAVHIDTTKNAFKFSAEKVVVEAVEKGEYKVRSYGARNNIRGRNARREPCTRPYA